MLQRWQEVTTIDDDQARGRLVPVAAWALAGVTLALLGVAAVLAGAEGGVTPATVLGDTGAFAMFSLVGALILTHRRANVVGWIMLGAGLAFVLDTLSIAWVEATVAGRDLPGAVWAAWLASWVWSPGWSLAFGWLPLLFPDGRVLSRRWRILVVLMVLGSLQFVPAMLLPELEYGDDGAIFGPNPIGLPQHGVLLETITDAVASAFLLMWLAVVVHQVLRYRRADTTERLQLRWFLFAIITAIGSIAVTVIPGVGVVLEELPFSVPIVIIPLSVGVAVTRYRLYDIDRIISRALTFTVVVGVLGAVYVAGVLAIGALLQPIAPDSDLAVAIATLLAAGAFRPLLTRVRARVDHRFDRARYDAVAEVEAFGLRLRDELDLHQIRTDLSGASLRTMQPAAAWVWLPPRP